MILSKINAHDRDKYISFQEEGHIYTLYENINPESVTTIIHKYFPSFDPDKIINKMMKSKNWPNSKYFGKTKKQIKDEWNNNGKISSELGTKMHADIEYYLNDQKVLEPDNIEFKYFLNFWSDFNKKYPEVVPYRTEWVVYDEDKKFAGSIDCVLADKNDNLILVDWKRSKEIKKSNVYEKGYKPFDYMDNCNFSHYTLQLNFYRHILENKYNKNVIFMMLVVLHPNSDNYKCHPVEKFELNHLWEDI